MAEGFARQILAEENSLIDSAGLKADGANELAIKVMNEVGINIVSQISKQITSIDLNQFELIVTVCDNARDYCPVVESAKIVHKSFQDPAVNSGTLAERLFIYRKVRDEIGEMVQDLLKNYHSICQELN